MNRFNSREGPWELPANQLLTPYDIEVTDIEARDRWYEVSTADGNMALLFSEGDKSRLKYTAEAIQHLRSKGFTRCPGIIPTRDGSLYVEDGEHLYYLIELISGEFLMPSNQRLWEDGAKLLAEFHQASKGFRFPEGQGLWGEWADSFARRYKRLSEYKASLQRILRRSDFDRWFLYYVDYFLEQCQGSIESLSSSKYSHIYLKRQDEGGFCHGGLIAGNLVEESTTGQLYLVNFHNLMGDIPSRDIGDLLNFAGMWNIDRVDSFLETYNKTNPLTQEEIELIQAYLRFPHLFWEASFQYYERGNLDKYIINGLNETVRSFHEFLEGFSSMKVYTSTASGQGAESVLPEELDAEPEDHDEEVEADMSNTPHGDELGSLVKELEDALGRGEEEDLANLVERVTTILGDDAKVLWSFLEGLQTAPEEPIYEDEKAEDKDVIYTQDEVEEEEELPTVIEEEVELVVPEAKKLKYGPIVWGKFPEPID